MNKYSPKIDEVRAHVLDTESLLHFLCNRENLKALLAHGSPEVPIGAMLDGAYKSISEANGACIELEEVRDEDFRAEFKETAIQALDKAGQTEAGEKPAKPESLPAAIIPPNAAEDFDTLDEIYAQTGALLTMLFTYIGEVGPHGEELHPHVIQNYIWQIQSNNKRAARLSDEIYRGLKQGGSNHA